MTEAEWLACGDPTLMLEFLRGRVSDRKLRLYAAACCRHVWPHLAYQTSREAVEAAERYADGQIDAAHLAESADVAWPACEESRAHGVDLRAYCACGLAWCAALPDGLEAAMSMAGEIEAFLEVAPDVELQAVEFFKHQRWVQPMTVHDIFGNPFRPLMFDSAWHTATVASFAQAIYVDRAFDRLPILADALEDAGCDNRAILDHCRQRGEHVRGCWVVDLVLDKS